MAGQRSRQSMRGTSCVALLLGSAVLFVAVPAVWGEGTASALQVQQVWTRSIAGLPNSMKNAASSPAPLFISTVVTPHVLAILHTSGSRGYRAVCDNTTHDFFPLTSITKVGTTATVPYGFPHMLLAGSSI